MHRPSWHQVPRPHVIPQGRKCDRCSCLHEKAVTFSTRTNMRKKRFAEANQRNPNVGRIARAAKAAEQFVLRGE